jgi:3-hydroxyisobutyrate dehydrogenase-like beta-hydroxyacid dehydrogenase
MVRRLLAAGHEVLVWNRTAARLRDLVASGAREASTPAALADECEIVCLCVYDARAVDDVVFGEHGVAGSRRLKVLVDHSSIPPAETRDMAARLAAANGAIWIDAPVSGGTGGAEQGTLAIMAGGPEHIVEDISPLLMAYAQRITHMGAVGSGQITKLCNQMIVATTIAAIGEAVSLASDNDVDAARLSQALAGGWADSTLLQIFVPRMLAASGPRGAALDTMLKDLDTTAELAQARGTAMPVSAAAQQTYRLASSMGWGPLDVSQLIRLYRRGMAVNV